MSETAEKLNTEAWADAWLLALLMLHVRPVVCRHTAPQMLLLKQLFIQPLFFFFWASQEANLDTVRRRLCSDNRISLLVLASSFQDQSSNRDNLPAPSFSSIPHQQQEA